MSAQGVFGRVHISSEVGRLQLSPGGKIAGFGDSPFRAAV
jgi:hypothetical protein